MLKGDKVILRPMRREYLEKYFEYRNDVELQLLGRSEAPTPVVPERLAAEYEAYLAVPDREAVWFAIEVQGGKFIGQCLLHQFDHASRTCQLTLTIGDRDYMNRGYGRDTVKLLARYAFRLLNIRKVWLTTHASNARAIKSFAAAGFEEEARLRAHTWRDGVYDDQVFMSCFREDARPSAAPEAPDPEPESSPHAEDAA